MQRSPPVILTSAPALGPCYPEGGGAAGERLDSKHALNKPAAPPITAMAQLRTSLAARRRHSRARMAKTGPRMGSLTPTLQNEKETGRRQRQHPDPVEIDPSPTQKRQAQPFIDQARDRRRDGQHGAGMHGHGGERDRQGSRRRQLAQRRRREAERDDHGDQHQAGAMAGRHRERPQPQPDHAGLHADAQAMAMPVERVIDGPAQQYVPGQRIQKVAIEDKPKGHDSGHDDGDRKRMSHRDRDERQPYDAPAPPVQPQRRREQPPHGGVDAVEGAEAREDEPRRYFRHRLHRGRVTTSPAQLLWSGHNSKVMPPPSYGGGAPEGGGGGRPYRRSPIISDLELASTSTGAFPLRPCGPPPPCAPQKALRRGRQMK